MNYVYILKSESSGKYYIGETGNMEARLSAHKQGRTSFGKRNENLKIVYKKEFNNRNDAKYIESFLKQQKSHLFIDRLISGKITLPCSSVGRASGCVRAKRAQNSVSFAGCEERR